LTIKIRLHEQIVDYAARFNAKPDKEIEREMRNMIRLRDQTYRDIKEYLKIRDKRPWRNWDKYRFLGPIVKPSADPGAETFEQLEDKC